MEGCIKFYNVQQRYGFIEVAGEPDVFFPERNLHTSIDRDESLKSRRVVFRLEHGKRGPVAVGIRAAD